MAWKEYHTQDELPDKEAYFTLSCLGVSFQYADLFCDGDCSQVKCKEVEPGSYITVMTGQHPSKIEHTINTDYSFEACGVTIPLVKTTRTFRANWEILKTPYPENIALNGSTFVICSNSRNPWEFSTSISENCIIEKCSLHYLDHANKVMLYRYVKESVQFSDSGNDYLLFRPDCVVGNLYAHNSVKHKLKTEAEAEFNCLEEWRLVVDGVTTVLSSVPYKKAVMPWGGPIASDDGQGGVIDYCELYGAGTTDKYSIFVFPMPGSRDCPAKGKEENKYLYCNGYYDLAGNDNPEDDASGGHKDYFYPSWCRSLHEDPFWKHAANQRLGAWQDKHGVLRNVQNPEYSPPPISVEPIPKGSYVKHPKLGAFFQFLTTDKNGVSTVTESRNITNFLDKKLDPKSTHDTTLYYPISLI